jgi:hypothetical protein
MATVLGSKRKEEKGTGTYSTASFPGFKFSPTDEQLIDHYLRLKNEGRGSEVQVIGEVDFYKYEPWDLPGTFFSLNKLISFLLIWLGVKHACVMFLLNLELSVLKSDQRDWFFFCRRDAKAKKQARSTSSGYWKATGKDRIIESANRLLGMKKTLVFYLGRAPQGRRTEWIMHEYMDIVETSPHQVRSFFLLSHNAFAF